MNFVKNEARIGFVVLLIIIVFAVFSVVVLYRSSYTGGFVEPSVPKKYIYVTPEVRDSRLLYCPEGLFPEMGGVHLEAQMNAGRNCIPSPYVNEYPRLTTYYCCSPVFTERYIENRPRNPTSG